MNQERHAITINYRIIKNLDALDPADRELILRAAEVTPDAYAPYSGFRVGAAIRLQNGQTVIGNNQENAAYPSGLCAERVAAFGAGASYPGSRMESLAVVAARGSDRFVPVTPCGACRQVLFEYEKKQKTPIRILLSGESGSILIFERIEDLLPVAFSKNQFDPNEDKS